MAGGRLGARLLPADPAVRAVAASALVGSFGFGLYTTGSLFYFTRSVGLSLTDVGLGLTISALLALVLSVPAGRLADRWGHRDTAIACGIAAAAVLAAATLVTTFVEFLVVVCLLAVAEQVGNVARGAVVATIAQGSGRVRLSAYVRSVVNLGITAGILLSGLALAVDTRTAYLALVLGNGASALLGSLLFLRVPASPPAPARADGGRAVSAIRDLSYLAASLVIGVLLLSDACLAIGLPLWVVNYTDAPRPLAAWLIAVNTGLVILFQSRASRRVHDVASAGRTMIMAAGLLALACGFFAVSGRLGWLAAAGVLLVGVCVLTLAELWASAAGWSLRYDLAHDQRQGAYGAVFNLGTSLRTIIGPAVTTASLQYLRGWGWVLFGVLFLLAAAATRPVLAWAVNSRPWAASGALAGGAPSPREARP